MDGEAVRLPTEEELTAQRIAAHFGTTGDPVGEFRPLFAHVRAQRPDDQGARLRLPPSMHRRLEATGRDWRAELDTMAAGFGFTNLTLEAPDPVAAVDGAAVLPARDSDAEWGRVIARLHAAGTSTIEVGQCEHGWFARGRVPAGRATLPIDAHGYPSRLEACAALADEAIAKSDGKRRRTLPKAKARRKAKR